MEMAETVRHGVMLLSHANLRFSAGNAFSVPMLRFRIIDTTETHIMYINLYDL